MQVQVCIALYTVHESLTNQRLSNDYHEINFIYKVYWWYWDIEKGNQFTEALAALSTASKFLEWAGDSGNQADLKGFSRKLVEALKEHVPEKCARNPCTQREKMWSSFRTLRVSDPSKNSGMSFLTCVVWRNTQFFSTYQWLIFQELIAKEFTVTTHDAPTVLHPLHTKKGMH